MNSDAAPSTIETTNAPAVDIARALLQLSGYTSRVFLISSFVLVLGLGLVAGGYAALIAMNGTVLRAVISGILASGVTGVVGFVLAFKITVFYTTARAVKQSALGTRILRLLLKTGLDHGVPDNLDYSEADLKRSLLAAGARINQNIVPSAAPRLMRRLIRAGIAFAIRIVTARIMDAAGMMHADGHRITKASLLTSLADRIDQFIIDELRGSIRRFIVGCALLVLLMIGLCAHLIRLIPGF